MFGAWTQGTVGTSVHEVLVFSYCLFEVGTGGVGGNLQHVQNDCEAAASVMIWAAGAGLKPRDCIQPGPSKLYPIFEVSASRDHAVNSNWSQKP